MNDQGAAWALQERPTSCLLPDSIQSDLAGAISRAKWRELCQVPVDGDAHLVRVGGYRELRDRPTRIREVERRGVWELTRARTMTRHRDREARDAALLLAAREGYAPVPDPPGRARRESLLESFGPATVEHVDAGREGFTLPGFGGSMPGCGRIVLARHPANGCERAGAITKMEHRCGGRSCCPQLWVPEQAASSAAHFEGVRRALKWRAKFVRHIIISPPQDRKVGTSDEVRELRREAFKFASKMGAKHGKIVFHAWRCADAESRRDPSEWTWGPHFHVVALAGAMDVRGAGGLQENGWVLKLAAHDIGYKEYECARAKARGAMKCYEVHDIAALLRYELDHAGLRADVKAITEYGAMATNSKLLDADEKKAAREAAAEAVDLVREERARESGAVCELCGVKLERLDDLDAGEVRAEGPPTRRRLA